jgi:hypothetical protein
LKDFVECHFPQRHIGALWKLGRASHHWDIDNDITRTHNVYMITSRQILKATGLKNAKTLTRWAKAGFIPKPQIGTHPKGRGKIAFWPDWVLERCQRIVKLQKQGHSLVSAISAIEHERMLGIFEQVKTSPSLDTILSEKKIRLAQGGELDLATLLHLFILKGVENVISDLNVLKDILAAMRTAGVATQGIQLLQAGYNPICVFDGQKADVMPDFRIAHMLADDSLSASSRLVIPLLPSLQKAFSSLGLTPPPAPAARAAPKIQSIQSDAVVEYDIFLVGDSQFELIRETARTIGSTNPSAETSRG